MYNLANETYIKDPDEGKQHLVVVVYMGVALLTSCLYLALWEYASRNRRLIDPRLGPHLLKTIRRELWKLTTRDAAAFFTEQLYRKDPRASLR